MDITTFDIYLTPTTQDPTMQLGEMLSNVATANELSYQSSPTRTNDMTLFNDEDAFYVPTVEITLGYLGANDYAKLMQVVNSKGLIVYYFDVELNEYVYRAVYVSEKSLERLHAVGGDLSGLVGTKVKFVSRWGYPYVTSNDPNCLEENKFHMYNLHRLKGKTDDPSGRGYPDYA